LSRIWSTSDYHMGHRNIIGLCGRPFAEVDEMEREIIARHNELVAPDDGVDSWGFRPASFTEIRDGMDAVAEEFSEG
jgi:hypothetical protein